MGCDYSTPCWKLLGVQKKFVESGRKLWTMVVKYCVKRCELVDNHIGPYGHAGAWVIPTPLHSFSTVYARGYPRGFRNFAGKTGTDWKASSNKRKH